MARNVPLGEHRFPGSDRQLRTSPHGKSLPGGLGEQLSSCPPRESGSCLSDGGLRALDCRVNMPSPRSQNHVFQTNSSSKPLIRLPGGRALLLGNAVLSGGLLGGQCELIALGPLPAVSANNSRGLQLRSCFSSLADVCFNLIKWFTGLSGRMRTSVGHSPGGWWERLGVLWAPHPGHEAQQGRKKDQAWAKMRFKKSSPCLTSWPASHSHIPTRVPQRPHSQLGCLLGRPPGSETSVSVGGSSWEVGLLRPHRQVPWKNCFARRTPEVTAR